MSEAIVFESIPQRPPPVHVAGFGVWLRRNLFPGPFNSIATVLLTLGLAWLLWHVFDWGIVNAIWRPDLAACRALDHSGACWGMITEKFRLIFFGRYPFEEQWRPLIATLLMLAMILISCAPRFWSRMLFVMWIAGLALFFVLMYGGIFGLSTVDTERWGGFPLTLLLSTVGIGAAFPLAVLVALGRRSRLPGIRTISIVYVEFIRGVPLVSVLFMASFMFPLFMPPGTSINVLVRVLVGIILFAAAYLAEVVRGGLQSIPRGQTEAAITIGLSYWQTQRKIVLPQALRAVVPATVNTFIGTFKDTSLVTIVGLYELTGALRLATGDADWRAFYIEGYIFIALIYFICCFSMSRYSQWIEKRLNTDVRR
jgi:general L-amino acid transport system permease protein